MKPEERLAEKYLSHLGIGPVEYEPIKNQTPDFLVDGRIAVEVRRLNENLPGAPGQKNVGLEQDDIPLQQRVRAVLRSYGKPASTSASVGYRFSRPIEWKKIEPELRRVLDVFRNGLRQHPVREQITKSFFVAIHPLSMPLQDEFRLHVITDEDSGGMIVDLIKRNLEAVVPEKQQKVAKNRARYPEWWLVLVDTIGLGPDEVERESVGDAFSVPHTFDKIIILNATDPTDAFEL